MSGSERVCFALGIDSSPFSAHFPALSAPPSTHAVCFAASLSAAAAAAAAFLLFSQLSTHSHLSFGCR